LGFLRLPKIFQLKPPPKFFRGPQKKLKPFQRDEAPQKTFSKKPSQNFPPERV